MTVISLPIGLALHSIKLTFVQGLGGVLWRKPSADSATSCTEELCDCTWLSVSHWLQHASAYLKKWN